jgi:hypothetical protein
MSKVFMALLLEKNFELRHRTELVLTDLPLDESGLLLLGPVGVD